MSAPVRRIIPVFIPHLGCPHNCVFCNQRRISGEETPADEQTVLSALSAASGDGISASEKQLAFYGGSFTAIPSGQQEQLLKAADGFVSQGGTLRVSTRPDYINNEVLQRLKRYGVRTVELGCQSMDSEVLRKSGRGHTADDVVKAADLVKKSGFELILQMMTGLPGDTRERSLATARALAALKPDGVRIYPTVIILDTPLYDLWKSGNYREHTVREAVAWCADILPVFEKAEIPVIRLGLNPTDELSGGEAVGGAYHPAFGELVSSELYYRRECELMRERSGNGKVSFFVNPASLSAAIGHKKTNLRSLQECYPDCSFIFVPSEKILRGEIEIECEK